MSERRRDLDRFYSALAHLERRLGGRRLLGSTSGRDGWPSRGVYFVFEPGEHREDTNVPRVVRVGTHALTASSASSLWGRLHQHRGTRSGGRPGGNHRSSVFRFHVGEALIRRGDVTGPGARTWEHRRGVDRAARAMEEPIEQAVSETLATMDVLWLAVDDEPGPDSLRGVIERNAIALLSNAGQTPVDPPSPTWLGHHARAEAVRASGLWNVRHITERYERSFLDRFERLVDGLGTAAPRPAADSAAGLAAPAASPAEPPDGGLAAFDRLRVWRRGGQRAPHKPLLVLLMLGRLRREDRLVAFADVEEDLRALLRDFGPPAVSVHPEYPFWFLQSDGVWEVPASASVPPEQRRRGPPVARMRGLAGGFNPSVHAKLRADPELARRVARGLLEAHFPASLHQDILDRCGLTLELPPSPAQRRDPRFRLEVLRAYEYRCAVCGYDGKLDAVPVGLDAAHVRWWAAGGPDTVANGLALCVLHHKALDLGIIGIGRDRCVLVSTAYHGHERAREYVTRFAGMPLARPQPTAGLIDEAHRRWHAEQVFRTPARAHAQAAEEPGAYAPD